MESLFSRFKHLKITTQKYLYAKSWSTMGNLGKIALKMELFNNSCLLCVASLLNLYRPIQLGHQSLQDFLFSRTLFSIVCTSAMTWFTFFSHFCTPFSITSVFILALSTHFSTITCFNISSSFALLRSIKILLRWNK